MAWVGFPWRAQSLTKMIMNDMNDARIMRHRNGLPKTRESIVAVANDWADALRENGYEMDFCESHPGAWDMRFNGRKIRNIPTCALLHVINAVMVMSH